MVGLAKARSPSTLRACCGTTDVAGVELWQQNSRLRCNARRWRAKERGRTARRAPRLVGDHSDLVKRHASWTALAALDRRLRCDDDARRRDRAMDEGGNNGARWGTGNSRETEPVASADRVQRVHVSLRLARISAQRCSMCAYCGGQPARRPTERGHGLVASGSGRDDGPSCEAILARTALQPG